MRSISARTAAASLRLRRSHGADLGQRAGQRGSVTG
jgi:hypothetical protein